MRVGGRGGGDLLSCVLASSCGVQLVKIPGRAEGNWFPESRVVDAHGLKSGEFLILGRPLSTAKMFSNIELHKTSARPHFSFVLSEVRGALCRYRP